MKILYFDCFAGAAGDMIVGALLDAGLPFDELKRALGSLAVDGWDVSADRVLKTGVTRPHSEIEADAIKLVRNEIGPVAAFKSVLVVERLPKTRSGKTLRGTLRSIADGVEYRVPATIDDPAILAEITDALAAFQAKHAGGKD